MEANTINLTQNPIIKESVIILVKWLSQSFRRQEYDCNSMLRLQHERLEKCFEDKIYKEEQIKQYKGVQKDISIFIWQLSVAPKFWVRMLNNEQIFAKQSKSINLHNYTKRIYKKIQETSLKMTPYFKDFMRITVKQVFEFLELVSIRICDYFNRGRNIILEKMQEATEQLKGSKIVNIFTLFKILRDISRISKNLIIQITTQGMFKNIQNQISVQFAHFIIEKHQVLKLDMKVAQCQKSIDNSEQKILQQIGLAKNVSWREIVREDGQKGILVELQQQATEQQPPSKQNYIIKIDRQGDLEIMNGFSLTKKWKMQEQVQKNHDILKLVKDRKALAQKLRNSSMNPKTALTAIDHVGTLGGSLGKCLADIDKYNSVGQFMTDLSKKTIISGSFNYLLQSIPMLGYIFVVGGFTYSFYYIFTNNVSDSKRKFQDIGKITIDTTSTIGSGFLGALVGQTLIPVPFLGAFIGGVVGGLVGGIGGKQISKFIQSARFNDTIKILRKNLDPKGFWQPNKINLEALGLNKQYFYESIPSSLKNKIGRDRQWITLICFTILSFYFADQRDKFMKKKLKELQKKKKILQGDDVVDEQQYEVSVDFISIMTYLEQENIIYLKFNKQLEAIISEMYSRLK